MISTFVSFQYPTWMFVEFTEGDRGRIYDILPGAAPLWVDTYRFLANKDWMTGYLARTPVVVEDIAPDWVINTHPHWLGHALRAPAPKKEKLPKEKLPKDPTIGMEKNFWPVVKSLSGMPEKLTKKILCH